MHGERLAPYESTFALNQHGSHDGTVWASVALYALAAMAGGQCVSGRACSCKLWHASLTLLRQLKSMMAYVGTPECHGQVLARSPLSLSVVVVV